MVLLPPSIVVVLCGGVAAGRAQPAESERRKPERGASVPPEVARVKGTLLL